MNEKRVFLVVVGTVALLTLIDLVFDLTDVGETIHMLLEFGLFVFSVSALALFAWRFAVVNDLARDLRADLRSVTVDVDRWKKRAHNILIGLGQVIDQQFDEWSLTPAEKEVGLLVLKGLTLREISVIRGTSERTVRQQSQSIYRKSGLEGRASFSAFFLEDLLLPLET